MKYAGSLVAAFGLTLGMSMPATALDKTGHGTGVECLDTIYKNKTDADGRRMAPGSARFRTAAECDNAFFDPKSPSADGTTVGPAVICKNWGLVGGRPPSRDAYQAESVTLEGSGKTVTRCRVAGSQPR